MPRSYGQFCALARALDLVGERWTLLIARELLYGPRRYTDLQGNLPGIGTNLLASRLRRLEGEGLIRKRTLPPPAAGQAYELTERGRGLETSLIELARWGMAPIAPPAPGDEMRPGWYLLAMQAAFRPTAAESSETYELRVDGEIFHLRVRDGNLRIRQGPADEPDVSIRCTSETLLALLTGAMSPARASREGALEATGERAALGRLVRIFPLPEPAADAAAIPP